MCGSVRQRLPGMMKCHQKVSHTTTETPVTIPRDHWPPGTVEQTPSAGGSGVDPTNPVDCTRSDYLSTPENDPQPLSGLQNAVSKSYH